MRFYAGVPLRDASGHVLGTLCLLDVAPRSMTQREVKLLEAMADDIVESLRQSSLQWNEVAPVGQAPEQAASAIVGQRLLAG